MDRCLDDHTLVQCNGPSMHREINCPTYLRSYGPQCIVGTGRVGCGVGTCSTAGQTCDGSIWHSCASGIEGVLDCAPVGTECSTINGCVLPKPGACTIPFGCEGDLLCSDNGTEDCTQVVPDGTCITVNNFNACGWAAQCDVSSVPDTCLGTTLRRASLARSRISTAQP